MGAGCPQPGGAARLPCLRNCSLINYHFHKQRAGETPTTTVTLPATAPGPAAQLPGELLRGTAGTWHPSAGCPEAAGDTRRPRGAALRPLPFAEGSSGCREGLSRSGLPAPQPLSFRRL